MRQILAVIYSVIYSVFLSLDIKLNSKRAVSQDVLTLSSIFSRQDSTVMQRLTSFGLAA